SALRLPASRGERGPQVVARLRDRHRLTLPAQGAHELFQAQPAHGEIRNAAPALRGMVSPVVCTAGPGRRAQSHRPGMKTLAGCILRHGETSWGPPRVPVATHSPDATGRTGRRQHMPVAEDVAAPALDLESVGFPIVAATAGKSTAPPQTR